MTDEQIRAAKAQYARSWRQQNPEKAREISARYWQRKAEENVRLMELSKGCLPCSCGHRPHIRQNRKTYEISCIYCRKTLPPVGSAEEAVSLWNRMADTGKKRTTAKADYHTPEDR